MDEQWKQNINQASEQFTDRPFFIPFGFREDQPSWQFVNRGNSPSNPDVSESASVVYICSRHLVES